MARRRYLGLLVTFCLVATVAIVASSALTEMRKPGLLALCFPIIVGLIFKWLGSWQGRPPERRCVCAGKRLSLAARLRYSMLRQSS